jgi:hypothetical protein
MPIEKSMVAAGPPKPQQRFFTKRAIQRAVLSRSLNHPLTLFPMAMSLVGGFWLLLMGPTFSAVTATIASAAIGLGSWIVQYFFLWEQHANAYLVGLTGQLRAYRKWSQQEIKRVLEECESLWGVKKFASKGNKQYDEINRKFDLFKEILTKKLDTNEFTYARYLGSAEQLYLNTLDGLRDLVNFIKGIAAIGSDYQDEMKRLQAIDRPSELEKKQLSALMERDLLRLRQEREAAELLTLNEQALTKIDMIIAAFSETRTRRRQSDVDIETAIKEIDQLANQVKEYAVRD